jgi:cation:H+ antiporter
MLLYVLVLVGGLAVLTAGAELLVRGASSLALRLGVSSFFIGLTIVGFGTSTPELATGVAAAVRSMSEPAYSDVNVGNVIGSNIFNVAAILGLVAVLSPIAVRSRVVRNEVLLVILVAFLPLTALLTGGTITRVHAAVFVLGLVLFILRGYVQGRAAGAGDGVDGPGESAETRAALEATGGAAGAKRAVWVDLLLIGLGLLLLVGGSEMLVRSAVAMARQLEVDELVISLTIVAAGTSAPELFTSLVAAVRKQSDLSVGNILGSNIFNILGILGVASLVFPQRVASQVFWLDLPVMIVACIALLPIVMTGGRISRGEGAALLAGYLVYVGVVLWLALR